MNFIFEHFPYKKIKGACFLKMRKIYQYLYCASALAITGCTSPVTPDFMEMSTKYSNLLETYQINMMLTNIMRASFQEPLSFLDMPNINGSGSVTNSPSVNSIFATPSIVGSLGSVATNWALSFGNSFTFTQSSLDNATFWKGMEAEIPLESVQYFLHNHIAREVAFSLAVDEIQIQNPDGYSRSYINNPLRPEYPEFQAEMYKLLNLGLTITSSEKLVKIGGPLSELQLALFYSTNASISPEGERIEIKMVSEKPIKLYQRYKASKNYRLCIPNRKNQNEIKASYGDDIFCDSKELSSNTDDSLRSQKLNVKIRSTRNIYYFLGQVASAQLRSSNPYLVTLPPTASTFNGKDGESNQYALLVINKNADQKRSFASYEALDGNVYTIPRVNNGYSSIIIDMLTQFQTLAKVPGSVPPSPAVILR
jgi:hypothetical protein